MRCPNYYIVSAGDCRKEDDATNLGPQSSAVSTSRNLVVEVEMFQKQNCAEGTYGATSNHNGFASSTGQNKVACIGNPKDGEVSVHPIEKIDSTWHISVHSDVSSETGPPLNREQNEFDVGRAMPNWLNAGEDGMHATLDEAQLKTESSCSSLTHVILPVSSSNDSYQEISVEANSSMHGCSDATNFVTTGLKCRVGELAARSLVLDMAAKITQKSVGNVSEIELGMMANQNSMIIEKVDIPKYSLQKHKFAELLRQEKHELDDALNLAKKVARQVDWKVGIYREASGSFSSTNERTGETVHSKDPNKSNCSTESGGRVKLCNEQENSDSFCSNEVVVDPKIQTKGKCFLAMKRSLQKTDSPVTHEANDGPHGKESTQLITKPEVLAGSDQRRLHCRFDLNDELEYPKQSVDETVFSHNVINVSMPVPVVAKCGVPMCLHMTPLKFEGEQGWRGTAATSAFRPASLSKSSNRNRVSSVDDNNCSSKGSQGVTGIDLNVAAVGDDSAIELLPTSCVSKPLGFPFKESTAEVSSQRAERLNIDLNLLIENDDNCSQASSPVQPARHSVLDFDLNGNPSHGDTCTTAHQPGQGSRPLRGKAIDDPAVAFMRNSGQRDSNSAGPVYRADLSSMQGSNHGHVQPFLVVAPNVLPPSEQMQRVVSLQPKLSCTPRALLPHIYHYNNGFCIGPTEHLSATPKSSAVLPYMTDPRGRTVIPQILGAGGPSPNDIRHMIPSFNVNSGLHSLETGSRGGNAGNLLFPVKNSIMEEQMKSSQEVSATILKRREPGGGWDFFQLSYRR